MFMREYIVHRKKSTSIKSFLLMIFCVALFSFFAFFELLGLKVTMDSKVSFYIAKWLSIFLMPVVLLCCVFYFKNIFNKKPILVINEDGLQENSSAAKSLGVIKWKDIETINIVPYMDKIIFICIHLKNPEKYISNQRRLNRIKRKKRRRAFGEVNISSLYFKKEVDEVLNCMKYHLELARQEQEKYTVCE